MKRLLILVVLAMGVYAAAAQDVTVSPALEEQLAGIEEATSAIRGLNPLQPVERRFPTRDDVRAYLQRTIDEELPEDALWRESQFYAAFDLLPADTDLGAIYLELLGSQIAGYYDSDTQSMNVVPFSGEPLGEELGLIDQITYAHEFVHALQDQYYGLEKLGLGAPDAYEQIDRLLAVQALIEGDATYVMNQFAIQAAAEDPIGAAMELLASGLQAGTLTLPPDTPPVLAAELMYPYFDGLSFVSALIDDGGWEAVNRAFENPPQSTEQILHPDRYLAGDVPQAVTLKPAGDTLPGGEWELVIERTLGEFYLRQYLGTLLTNELVNEAATGWGGDLYQLFYNPASEERAFVLRLVWDTPSDGDEFASAYRAFAGLRVGSGEAPCWSDDAAAICFVHNEDGSLIAFAPTVTLATQMMEAQQ